MGDKADADADRAEGVTEDAPHLKPLIFCFINSGRGTDWVASMALAEDGTCLAQHVSSSDSWAKIDIGCAGKPPDPATAWPGQAKRDVFAEHYPGGYDLVWVDDPATHEGVEAAYALNQAARREACAAEGHEMPEAIPVDGPVTCRCGERTV